MRRVQGVAVDLFGRRGFDAVTVEEVAAAADVAPVSVYRWFGSKEGLVLWDDFDPPLVRSIAERLGTRAPLVAVRDAVVSELDGLYDRERELVLARTQLVHREPALLDATAAGARTLTAAIAAAFAAAGTGRDDHERDTLAAVAVAVLVTAVDAWQRDDGRTPLATLVRAGFDRLAEVTS